VELDAVVAVSRRGSFRAAAVELGMSPTALSHAVNGLDARLRGSLVRQDHAERVSIGGRRAAYCPGSASVFRNSEYDGEGKQPSRRSAGIVAVVERRV
jgi:hypothetical protein